MKKILENLIPGEEKNFYRYFSTILILSIAFHFLAVFFSEGFHRPDEHLGIIRFMAFKLGSLSQDILSWEYPAQIRPWLQPGFYYLIVKIFNFIGIENPFTLAFILRFTSSFIGFLSLIFLTINALRFLSEHKTKLVVTYLTFLFWYIPFFHARTTSENLSTSFLIFGLFPLLQYLPLERLHHSQLFPKRRDTTEINLWISFICGICLGFAFILRFQVGIMVFFILAWLLFYAKLRLKSLTSIVFGILAMIAVSTVVDFWGYGQWTFAPWNYFYQNIIKGVAGSFGVSPWYYYVTKTLTKGIPPLSLIFIVPFVWLWLKKPGHILTWATLPFLAVHSLVGHKELRFIFTLGLFSPLIFGLLIEKYKDYPIVTKFKNSKFFTLLIAIIIFQNTIALCIASIKPAYDPIRFYKHLYHLDDKIDTLYTLSVFRDQLEFYLKSPVTEIVVKDLKEVESLASTIDEGKKRWFLMDKFEHRTLFKSLPNCTISYISYPKWVLNINLANWQERWKIWALYSCESK